MVEAEATVVPPVPSLSLSHDKWQSMDAERFRARFGRGAAGPVARKAVAARGVRSLPPRGESGGRLVGEGRQDTRLR